MLIELNTIKTHFPNWREFLQPDGPLTPDDILDVIISEAEAELGEYVTVTSATITVALENHLMTIIRFRAFMLDKGNIEFEHKPQIIKEYERTLKILEQYRSRQLPAAQNPDPDSRTTESISFSGKSRVMDDWFTNDLEDLTDGAA